MSGSIAIRRGRPSDAGVIVEFNQRMARETEGKQLDRDTLFRGVTAALADETLARYFLACRGEIVIGQLMLTTEWSDWRNGPIWWIQSVYVIAEERRRGVYRSLHEHVRTLARSTAGVVGVRLYVEKANAVAQQAYRQLGMSDAGYVVFEEMFAR